jgi:methylated-DNA-[protein]-cysteine S-methyltransferase
MESSPQSIRLGIATLQGEFIARYSRQGLAELNFPTATKPHSLSSQNEVPAQVRAWHDLTSRALHQVLAGKDASKLPPLDWFGGTEFQQAVWAAMLKIKVGETRSYGEIAQAIGRPKAVRAVGGACGANPIPVLVPCHRVLAARQKIGGFSGGLKWKRLLLALEGAAAPILSRADACRQAAFVQQTYRTHHSARILPSADTKPSSRNVRITFRRQTS